jgi:hypothetical protein
MKRLYSLLVIALLAAAIITSCKKTTVADTTGGITDAEELAKDESFAAMNAAADRFDPQYLRLVYQDTRTVEELSTLSTDLIARWKAEPRNAEVIHQLVTLYHFKNEEQLKACAEKISSSLAELNNKYDLAKLLQTQHGSHMMYKARCLQAKAKVDAGDPSQKKVNGLWSDMVDGIINDFHYAAYIYDEGYALTPESGGYCGEQCCYEWQSCKINAQTRYYTNLWVYAGGGAVSFGGVGAAVGSTVPFWGNIIGAAGGAIWGAAMGTMTAMNIYNNDLNACANNYLACLAKKK